MKKRDQFSSKTLQFHQFFMSDRQFGQLTERIWVCGGGQDPSISPIFQERLRIWSTYIENLGCGGSEEFTDKESM